MMMARERGFSYQVYAPTAGARIAEGKAGSALALSLRRFLCTFFWRLGCSSLSARFSVCVSGLAERIDISRCPILLHPLEKPETPPVLIPSKRSVSTMVFAILIGALIIAIAAVGIDGLRRSSQLSHDTAQILQDIEKVEAKNIALQGDVQIQLADMTIQRYAVSNLDLISPEGTTIQYVDAPACPYAKVDAESGEETVTFATTGLFNRIFSFLEK